MHITDQHVCHLWLCVRY